MAHLGIVGFRERTKRTEGQPQLKRLLDVSVSALLLALCAPVLVLVAVGVRLRLASPVLFRQVRPGIWGKPFVLYKFRTMHGGHDAEGNLLPDKLRLTRIGRFLRATSLDELPELWNVLRGDMSLVGPRPLLMEYLDRYTPEQARRHEVRPGITGIAQVSGRNALTWEARLALDVWYVDNRSMSLDLKILVKTFMQVAKRQDISAPGHATMSEFKGKRYN
ncbi:MAG TPA: sugar transferase [Actinobacteria bacterium]|nr:sugar transferase [Actinomycetota bacterium]